MGDYILGVDFSAHEGSAGVSDAVLKQCAEGGVQFLINRASLGTSYIDTSYVRNIRRAEQLGWVTGGYHFLTHGRGALQADRFVGAMRKATGGLKDRLAVLDVEWAGSDRMAWPNYNDVEEFADRFFQLTGGHTLIIYTAEAYWTGAKIGNQPGKKFGPLWQARWTGGEPITNVTLPDKPPVAGFGGWNGRPPLWQFGQLRLKAGGVDGNAWYGTIEELRELAGPRKEVVADKGYDDGFTVAISAISSGIADIKVPPSDPGAPSAYAKGYKRGVADARDTSASAVSRLTPPSPKVADAVEEDLTPYLEDGHKLGTGRVPDVNPFLTAVGSAPEPVEGEAVDPTTNESPVSVEAPAEEEAKS